MFNKLRGFWGLIILGLVVFIPASAFAVITGSTSDGWVIYDPPANMDWQYRYGPSFIINSDDSIDMWTPRAGEDGSWDWISHRHSTDGGHTWGVETVVLKPTAGSHDAKSTCDPGVIKFGGYYYIGYTTTTDSRGTDNDVMIARSTSPTGPFEKWNGSGWGGNPQPMVTFDGPTDCYGAGEPSFVLKDGTVYVYYTWMSRDSSGNPINQTRVATASSSNSNWPGALTYRGVAINRSPGEDSTDVKYIDAYNKFVGIATARRFSPFGYINIWESTDGITFTPGTLPKAYINIACHNAGISGTETGHIDLNDNNFIAYAYGKKYGWWPDYLNPITLTNDNLPAVPEVYARHAGNGQVTLYFEAVAGNTYKIKYGTSSGNYTNTITGVTGSPYTVTGLTNGTAYYFSVVAVNAYGDSVNSEQLSAIPYNYVVSPRTSVTASSQLPGWEATKAIDSDINTTWSSNGYTWPNTSQTEWISVDTGANRVIKRVTLTPRQRELFGFPTKFSIQTSTDGANWVDADTTYNDYTLNDGYTRIAYEFNRPLYGRYVRLYATQLNVDNDYNVIFQMGDIKIEEISGYAAIASSSISGWQPYKIIDGSGDTTWSSNPSATSAANEWVGIDMGVSKKITGVGLKPRTYGPGACFPVDFKLQYSTNGTTWTDVPGQSYTNYPSPGSALQTFKFSSPVTARYIRMYATKLSTDQYGNYYCQLEEFYVFDNIQRTASASSDLGGYWSVTGIADNRNDTPWSSNGHGTEVATEWVKIDMGSSQNVSRLRVEPRVQCFPKDFRLEYSNDGVNWTTIPGQSYTNYYDPGQFSSKSEIFPFSTLINARYIRMYATKLRPDEYGNYYFQLAEIYVDP